MSEGGRRSRARRACAFAALAAVRCVGTIEAEAPEPGHPGTPAVEGHARPSPAPAAGATAGAAAACVPDPGPTFLRRLTNLEYGNTLRDLLGATDVTEGFAQDAVSGGFDNDAQSVSISPTHVAQYHKAAETVAAQLFRSAELRRKLLGCDPAVAATREGCLKRFTADFGRRAYRRPLTRPEEDALAALAGAAAADPDPYMAARLVVEGILQSPSFLFRIEVGRPDPGRPGLARLDGYEIATRLSYLLFRSTPDAALLEAAARGELDTSRGIAERWRAMRTDPRAADGLRSFHRQWLRTGELAELARDPATFPLWTDALPASLREEVDRLVGPLVNDRSGSFLDLLTTREVWVDAPLARLYGVPSPPARQWARTMLDGVRRAGYLTLASALAPSGNGSSIAMPIHRGMFVREVLLCDPPPPPPANIPDLPETSLPGVSDRKRLEAHSISPACAPCHRLLDPIGFGLSHYDAIGVWRKADSAGSPIDARGTIVLPGGGGSVDFEGGVELGAKLAAAPEVSRCVVRTVLRFGQGRDVVPADACTIDSLVSAFTAGGHSFQELLLAFVQSDAFRYRRNHGGRP